ncbi:hypothetical protein V8G54_036572 [Vigna mungo]|uniref:Uncharacterized protein n=1 Tax=Vigna mungo TaxID=3915 RepID=A0AAQ3MHX7_VIGMU
MSKGKNTFLTEPFLSEICTLRKIVSSSGFSFPITFIPVLGRSSFNCSFSISVAFKNGFCIANFVVDDGSSDARNGSSNNSFAEGLFSAGSKHFPINLCASMSSIRKNAIGSFP